MQAIARTIALELGAQLTATTAINSLGDQAPQSSELTALTVEELVRVAQGVTRTKDELHEHSRDLNSKGRGLISLVLHSWLIYEQHSKSVGKAAGVEA